MASAPGTSVPIAECGGLGRMDIVRWGYESVECRRNARRPTRPGYHQKRAESTNMETSAEPAPSRAQIVTSTMWDIESGFYDSCLDQSVGRTRNG